MKSSNVIQIAWESYTKGNKEAFGVIYEHYHRELTLYCLGKLKDLELAENAASDCLVKLLQQTNPAKIENLDHWIFTVAKNMCNTHWSKNNRRGSILKHIGEQQKNHKSPEVIRQLNDRDIQRLLKTILEKDSYEIWQLHQTGYNNEEISEQLGLKPKTVANKKSEARSLIKSALKKK